MFVHYAKLLRASHGAACQDITRFCVMSVLRTSSGFLSKLKRIVIAVTLPLATRFGRSLEFGALQF